MSYRSDSQELEKRRRAVFDAVMQLPERERRTFIERETAGSPELRASVLRLITEAPSERTGPLDRPLYQRSTPSRSVEPPPTRIGSYTVGKQLGAGGMGTVYSCRAEDGRLVAVKLLHARLQDGDFLRRFEAERAIHSRLRHPNVCKILDGGTAEHGTPFIVMELVNGEPIDLFCRRARAQTAQRLKLFSQVLAGVEYFHRQQVIHRDLKPANIFVTTEGTAKILDFGIAKIAGHRAGMTGQGPTRSVLKLMTIRYASPEQLQQRLSGRSSDVYALGVVLYELLAGRHPFGQELELGTTQLLGAMGSRVPVAPSVLAIDVPKGVDSMVLKAIRFDPAQRYGTAGQFLEELRCCLERRPERRLSAHSGEGI